MKREAETGETNLHIKDHQGLLAAIRSQQKKGKALPKIAEGPWPVCRHLGLRHLGLSPLASGAMREYNTVVVN